MTVKADEKKQWAEQLTAQVNQNADPIVIKTGNFVATIPNHKRAVLNFIRRAKLKRVLTSEQLGALGFPDQKYPVWEGVNGVPKKFCKKSLPVSALEGKDCEFPLFTDSRRRETFALVAGKLLYLGAHRRNDTAQYSLVNLDTIRRAVSIPEALGEEYTLEFKNAIEAL